MSREGAGQFQLREGSGSGQIPHYRLPAVARQNPCGHRQTLDRQQLRACTPKAVREGLELELIAEAVHDQAWIVGFVFDPATNTINRQANTCRDPIRIDRDVARNKE